ncbi:MAG: bacillithiol system redox-active protein YtxJ [Bacteroidetes bacterium]|nr:bacillithiol system redox-active protein YtxJ [Bacteroidota bacterium]
MLWHKLTDLSQLQDIQSLSKEQSANGLTVLIFKHSTRCSISSMALNRLETRWTDSEKIPAYYLDLLQHRDISNEIAAMYSVEHASPQVLLIKNGVCVYHASHTNIAASDILEAAK